MRRIAVVATTAALLVMCGTPFFSSVHAQSLTNGGGDSENTTSSSSSSSGSSDSSVTATPGVGAPAGTSGNIVPVPSHPSSEDAIPNTTQSSGEHRTTSHPSAHPGASGDTSATSNGSTAPAGGSGLSSLMGTGGDDEAKYDDSGEPFTHRYAQFFAPAFQLSVRGGRGLPPNKFVLHVSIPLENTSCIRIGNVPDEISYSEDGTVKIGIKKISIDLRDLPDGTRFKCQQKTFPAPFVDVVLDREELKKRKTHLIEFTTVKGTDDRYDVILTDHVVRLQPAKESRSPYVIPALPGQSRNPLLHWFYPSGTVLLYVQNSPIGQNVDAEIDRVANARGLTPLTDLWPEFKSPLRAGTVHYYVDKKNSVLKGIPDGAGAVIGSITVNKTVYGLQGNEVEPQNLSVYARAPNDFE